MNYFINGQKIKYNLYGNYIGKGCEVRAYKIDDNVIKIFKKFPRKKIALTSDSIERMKRISTKRILLPTDSLLDKKDKIKGYKMNYIENYGENSYFNLEKNKLKEEHQLLKEDIKELSNNKILIDDLIIENTVYNNGLYLIDPGSYIFDDEIDSNKAYSINMDYLNRYLIYEVLLNYHLNKYNNSNCFINSFSFSNRINFEYGRSNKEDILDFFSDIEEDSLGEFVKKRY